MQGIVTKHWAPRTVGLGSKAFQVKYDSNQVKIHFLSSHSSQTQWNEGLPDGAGKRLGSSGREYKRTHCTQKQICGPSKSLNMWNGIHLGTWARPAHTHTHSCTETYVHTHTAHKFVIQLTCSQDCYQPHCGTNWFYVVFSIRHKSISHCMWLYLKWN